MKKTFASLLIVSLLSTAACTSMNRTQQGALSGAAIGAAAGAGLTYLTGGRVIAGALIGGALGTVAGGIYGHEKGSAAKKKVSEPATH